MSDNHSNITNLKNPKKNIVRMAGSWIVLDMYILILYIYM